ncbi:MAG: DUF4177 domain-containing protein [Clostridia bacterium]|nr:DUF4177 domain-containing protein [Clostridia bacterium]
MYEYKIIHSRVKDAEDEINALAKDGWCVVSVINDRSSTAGSFKGLLPIVFEREQKNTLSL